MRLDDPQVQKYLTVDAEMLVLLATCSLAPFGALRKIVGCVLIFLGPSYVARTFHFQLSESNYGLTIYQNIFTMLIVIAAFGLLYKEAGLIRASDQKVTNRYTDCMYFSVVTWTTLGYGDFTPRSGLGRIIVAYEVLLGYIYSAALIAEIIAFASAKNI